MKRRSFLRSLSVGAAILVMTSCITTVCQAANKRPDVLFIAIDDMNDWTTLFDKDNPIKTPNMERLAKRGMFFNKAYCASPACCPSRAAIMTGIRPHNSGVYDNNNAWAKMMPNAITLSRYFAQNGYETYGAGKIFHHGSAGADIVGKPSFEKFKKMLVARKPKSGKNHNGYTSGNLSRIWFDWGQHDQKLIDLDTVEWCEQAMDTPQEKPRFLAAGIFKPHLPFYADAETFKKYPFDDTVMPEMPDNDLDDVSPMAIKMAHREHFIYSNVIMDPEDRPGSLKKMVQCYQASADFADQMVGRLLDKLDETGKADNTIIILWADHGYHLGDKESCVKFTLWEKANHVPFIIIAPGVTKPGTVCTKPVSLVDIYPTLVELAGLPAAKVDGKSLVPLLRDPVQDWHPALMTMGKGNHAIRSDRWRYIRYKDGSEELYDHSKDPWEWTNLATLSKYADVIAEHKKWLPTSEK
ncbi:MAG: sulfatase [Planctomycetes bacterium]|nr:sulfatase [Planctomycetota bacterium]